MNQLLVLFLTCLFHHVVCKETTPNVTARYTCIDKANKTILTVELNDIQIKFPSVNGTKMHDLVKEFNKTNGRCNELQTHTNNSSTIQFFLSFSNHQQLQLEFVESKRTERYHLEKIIYAKLNENGFIPEHYEKTKPHLKVGGKTEFKTGLQGYQCGKLNFKLVNAATNNTVELELGTLKFAAFQNSTSMESLELLECFHDRRSSFIPIGVGVGLLGLAGVVVAIYFVMRRKGGSE